MLPKTYKYLISLLLCFGVAGGVFGQKVRLYPDSAKNKYKPAALHFGADLIGAGKTIIRDDVDWLNFYAGMDFYKYTFNVEYECEYQTTIDFCYKDFITVYHTLYNWVLVYIS